MLGFKLSRFSEWRRLVMLERRRASVSALAVAMARALIRFRPWRAKSFWRRRLRRCRRCPVYNRRLRQCRPYPESPLGCGCYMPFAALAKRHGWMTEMGLEDSSRFCW